MTMEFSLRPSHLLAVAIFYVVFNQCGTQELNEPARNYIEGRLGNRKIWWCPSGYGYLSFCPQPTDWDNYEWCCLWPYMGAWKPSCCPFAIPQGAVAAVIIFGIVSFAIVIGLSCWCCFCCPLYKQLYETSY